jgi:hypothetical protein
MRKEQRKAAKKRFQCKENSQMIELSTTVVLLLLVPSSTSTTGLNRLMPLQHQQTI